MKRAAAHRLYEIDLTHLIALCSVCKYTEIVVQKIGNGTEQILCVARAKEIEENKQKNAKLARERRLSWRTKQGHHVLSKIDTVTMKAICSVCGRTDIRKGSRYKGKTYYTCGKYARESASEYKRSHRVGRPSNPHSFSQVDMEKGTALCATCGRVEIVIRLVNKYVTRRCINAVKIDKG